MSESRRRAKALARSAFLLLMRATVARTGPRAVLNVGYGFLGDRHRARLHSLCAGMFRDRDPLLASGVWRVRFHGREILLPLTRERAWQEWDSAVSIVGNDLEVKQSYEMLLETRRINVFFDIGGNYGTHSLLMLAHGVRVVTFEPNAACHDYLLRVARMNGFSPDIQGVALGNIEGDATLVFPEKETWLGKLRSGSDESVAMPPTSRAERVKVTTLDAYCARTQLFPDLIKIDTEGAEASVLSGALTTIAKARPVIILECFPEHRDEVGRVLDGLSYSVLAAPLTRSGAGYPLTRREFAEHPATNFVAIPDL